jgi:hypothetical protein
MSLTAIDREVEDLEEKLIISAEVEFETHVSPLEMPVMDVKPPMKREKKEIVYVDRSRGQTGGLF